MLTYFGYLFLFIFLLFMVQMINDGPFVFHSGTTHYINIDEGLKVDINKLNIKKGDTVIWTNYSGIRHTITNDNPKIDNSDILYEYDKYSYTFHNEGTFTFYSSLYENMEKIIVIVNKSTKGRQFYGEIINNIGTLIGSFLGSIMFYIIYGIRKTWRSIW